MTNLLKQAYILITSLYHIMNIISYQFPFHFSMTNIDFIKTKIPFHYKWDFKNYLFFYFKNFIECKKDT